MSEYQSSSTSHFSNTDCESNLCRSHGKAAGPHHSWPYQHDDDWEQLVLFPTDIELRQATPSTEAPQDPDSAPLTTMDSGIFQLYTPLTVEQFRVVAYKEYIARMYDHYQQQK